MITVVTGPPCSGKTTHVTQHAQPGDIVVDYDALAQALGSPHTHDHPDHLKPITRAARTAAIRAALLAHRDGARVWVIDGAPSRDQRRRYHQAGAQMIHLTAPRDELHRRATAAGRPARWHHYIDQHLEGQADQPQAQAARTPSGIRPW